MRSPTQLLQDLLAVSRDDDAVLRAIADSFRERVAFPISGKVVGAPITVTDVTYDGDRRHGLRAHVRRAGRVWSVALVDVALPDEHAAVCLGAYRTWLGLPIDPDPVTEEALLVSVVVLALRNRSAHCRYLSADREVTVRAARLVGVVPGEVLTLRPRKHWIQDGQVYMSGRVEARRIDIEALGITPLAVRPCGIWNPEDEWDPASPPDPWAEAQLARGRRARFEMEQVRPKLPNAEFDDPVLEANERESAGDREGARRIRQDTLRADLRCLDAHAHLGRMVMEVDVITAGRHYEVGVRIGRISLPESFRGVLPWCVPENRPFLRCLHGWGLSLWRQGRHDAALAVFGELMRVNPADHQGVRHLLPSVQAEERWDGR
ncbi:MAG: hypothetical protein ACI8PZ_005644 [Myxococcota bacterium]|jgi:hypothetical protein